MGQFTHRENAARVTQSAAAVAAWRDRHVRAVIVAL
jgi:hypothetical protein